ncbi:effector-associated constant component EACC1 [Streptomyces fulvorobeus]|uniref:Uncharacterized protein n=1 Tax=Streptomyces fulvorobeus TaxID=284028 RepID=A0A7J0C1M3_9ACTN|nr:hypothetical protein [Streptomyces fulvorobeus]NYE39408.1 hypothetical protein [Streptomyces fulvorobeus]GFM95636.1 hypothetical protein Sfulv_04470 [Streptomyces fulvorobeus]
MPEQRTTASRGELALAVHGTEAEQHLRLLYDWLTLEDDLRGRLRLRSRPVAEGEMGGVLDVLTVALGAGGTGALIARSVSTWLSQRRADITVTVKAPDGREVSIDVKRSQDPLAIIREVERLAAPPQE